MKLIGIELRRPAFGEITAAAVMGTGLWVATVGSLQAAHVAIDRIDAGALLVVMLWGCVCVRVGIRVERGGRHLAANLATSAVLLSAYQGACALLVL
jgi:hypothetical protein